MDIIEPMFKAMRDRAVVYTTLQLSTFCTLHGFLRRMATSRTPVNSGAINTELINQETEYGDEFKFRESDKKYHSLQRDSRRTLTGYHSEIDSRITWIAFGPQSFRFLFHM